MFRSIQGLAQDGSVRENFRDMRNIYFDIDATLISVIGLELRPHAHHVVGRLRASGFSVYAWSAMGDWYAKNIAIKYGIEFDGHFSKPPEYDTLALPAGAPRPHLVIDDCEDRLVEEYGGTILAPYYDPNPDDGELLRILDWIEAHPEIVAALAERSL